MSENDFVMIYGLYDPRNDKLRYVGKATNLETRLWEHINNARAGDKTHRSNWIRLLLDIKMVPSIKLLGYSTVNAWQVDEEAWIAKMKNEGVNLTNHTKGGDGIPGYKHSDETKEKIRQYNLKSGKVPPNWKSRKQSPEHVAKRIAARRKNDTYSHSEETKKKISLKNTGKNMGNTHTLGFKQTEETKRKKSKSLKKFYEDEEKRQAISDRLKGNKYRLGTTVSEETKAKTSAAHVKREQDKRAKHIARIILPYEDMISMSDDPRINQIRKLYLGGMIQKEIIIHLGFSPRSNRVRNRVKNAIETIPTIDNPNPEQPMLPDQLRKRKGGAK